MINPILGILPPIAGVQIIRFFSSSLLYILTIIHCQSDSNTILLTPLVDSVFPVSLHSAEEQMIYKKTKNEMHGKYNFSFFFLFFFTYIMNTCQNIVSLLLTFSLSRISILRTESSFYSFISCPQNVTRVIPPDTKCAIITLRKNS